MKVMQTVMDYIIEQAGKNDKMNLQFEKDILFYLGREYMKMEQNVLRCVLYDVDNALSMVTIMNSIVGKMNAYNSEVCSIVYNKFPQYYKTAYNQTDDLIEIGKTMSAKLSSGVHEFQQINDQYTTEQISFIRKHALELSNAYTSDKIEKIRAMMSDMMLRGKGNRDDVKAGIQKILDVNASKAEEIVQTELSRSYNYGQMRRLTEYTEENPGQPMKKYWYGFDDDVTCTECRDHIGEEYDIDDNRYMLPLHPRCRCIWLPSSDGWSKTSPANDDGRVGAVTSMYTDDQMADRINSRLGITYGNFIDKGALTDYLSGDRSDDTMGAIKNGRQNAIDGVKANLHIEPDTSNTAHTKDFNSQLDFWKNTIAMAVVDNDSRTLDSVCNNIQSLIDLPLWTDEQVSKWKDLLDMIK